MDKETMLKLMETMSAVEVCLKKYVETPTPVTISIRWFHTNFNGSNCACCIKFDCSTCPLTIKKNWYSSKKISCARTGHPWEEMRICASIGNRRGFLKQKNKLIKILKRLVKEKTC